MKKKTIVSVNTEHSRLKCGTYGRRFPDACQNMAHTYGERVRSIPSSVSSNFVYPNRVRFQSSTFVDFSFRFTFSQTQQCRRPSAYIYAISCSTNKTTNTFQTDLYPRLSPRIFIFVKLSSIKSIQNSSNSAYSSTPIIIFALNLHVVIEKLLHSRE